MTNTPTATETATQPPVRIFGRFAAQNSRSIAKKTPPVSASRQRGTRKRRRATITQRIVVVAIVPVTATP